ncbi:hypothetical protein J7426_14330 [Tropicibacter sp. R16_0]|uniref:DUF6441 family protein n=1 Tax=Tropicibacter sp. R16_0 TaxID=2821102 RepID=UPI001ADB5ACB|nr:DUF6441 family protein [Tropicibacter sp. R16_0]MBO9451447.1 hypothetical protein [Tropicibacter sp. R16_0]
MRILAAASGNLEEYMAEELELATLAVTEGVATTLNRTKVALQRDTINGGLGRRLAKSWKSTLYPKRGASLGAAGTVHTKAPVLVRAFEDGALIRSADGFWLAIPTDSAPKLGMGRKRINPSNFPEHRLGPLRFVYRPSGVSLLVVDNQRLTKRGTYAKSRSKRALATGNGLSTVPMFFLVRQARLKRRLNSKSVADHQMGYIAQDTDAAFARLGTRKSR